MRYEIWRNSYYVLLGCLFIPGPLSLALFIYTQVLVCQARARTRYLQGIPNATWMTRVLEAKKNLLLSAAMSLGTSFGMPSVFTLALVSSLGGIRRDVLYNALNISFIVIGNVALLLTPWVYILRRDKLLQYIFTKKVRHGEINYSATTKREKTKNNDTNTAFSVVSLS